MTELYGSDLMVGTLADLGMEFAAINPGASFRGIHESLVSSGSPEMILTLHENVAVAIGHGYAKSAGRPMAVILHNLVGLQSGSMGIFDAWADQVPIMILGGSGPSDTARRRPWIDWVHSARMQSLVVRDYLKWDDQPTSIDAVGSSLVRAHRIATTVPCGPTYVSLDVLLQEQPISADMTVAGIPASGDSSSITAPQHELEELVDLLTGAERPVIVADYVGKTRQGYEALIQLAEMLAVPVIDLQARHNFPTGHWADGTYGRRELLENADVVLALELRDLMFGIGEIDHVHHTVTPLVRPDATVVSVSTNQLMLCGFIDYCGPATGAREIIADTSVMLPAMVAIAADKSPDRRERRARLTEYTDGLRERLGSSGPDASDRAMTTHGLSVAVAAAVADVPWEIANGHLRGAVRDTWHLTRFNAHLGRNIGGGLGYGIGVAIGAALAHRNDDTVIVNLQNDGDLLYTPQGLWTAAKYDLPILNVVVNNRAYGQDRMHQTIVAKARNRDVANASVGIDIDTPDIDFAGLARAQGVEAWGPIADRDELDSVLAVAVKTVREERRPVLVDVTVPR
jgi:thiamine pyrophosphate-dependent acetolactate synthase large subunit-like protein